jgi:hypothetical protein
MHANHFKQTKMMTERSLLLRIFRSISRLFYFDFSQVSAEEREHICLQELRLSEKLAEVTLHLAVCYLVLGAVVSYFLVPEQFKVLASGLHLVGLVITAGLSQ